MSTVEIDERIERVAEAIARELFVPRNMSTGGGVQEPHIQPIHWRIAHAAIAALDAEPLESVLPGNVVVTFSGPHDIDIGDGLIEVGYMADVCWPSGGDFHEGRATGPTIDAAIRAAGETEAE